MAKKLRVVLNREGVRQLLRSEEMKAICQQHAADAVSRLGPGYAQDTYTGENRVNAMIWAETAQAKRDNAQNNTILKALK